MSIIGSVHIIIIVKLISENTCKFYFIWLKWNDFTFPRQQLRSINVTRRVWCAAFGEIIGMNKGWVRYKTRYKIFYFYSVK